VQLYTRACFCEHGYESSVSPEGHECFVHLSNYELIKEGSHGWQYLNTKFRENMSVRTAMSLYLLAQNTHLILPLALVLILKITSNCEAILDCISKMSEDMYCPSNCQTSLKSSVFCVLSFHSSVPLPAHNFNIDVPKPFPHTDNGAISSHLPCIFLSLSVLLIVKEYRSEFVTVRGLTPSRQGIL